jgi:hypothetical protein
LNFWTSALYDEKNSQWVWTATGQSVNYTNWDNGEPRFKEGEGRTIVLGKERLKMLVEKTMKQAPGGRQVDYDAHYICEKSAPVNVPRDNQMKQKSCSAGSDWTCRNEMTGCYCYQTIKVSSSYFNF